MDIPIPTGYVPGEYLYKYVIPVLVPLSKWIQNRKLVSISI